MIASNLAAGLWIPLSLAHPPKDQQVLIALKESVGDVFDVACFIGKQPDGELRWVLGDVRLESRQITHWARIHGPEVVEARP